MTGLSGFLQLSFELVSLREHILVCVVRGLWSGSLWAGAGCAFTGTFGSGNSLACWFKCVDLSAL